ncbi:hypothetical protein FS847_16375 [Streptomyces sp. ISID311]|nr:hypothetical protein FS847_16375 [Streptomyces sp. ISID311]
MPRQHRPDEGLRRFPGGLTCNFRAVVTRFDNRAYVFQGTVTVTAIRLWLRHRSIIRVRRGTCHRSPERSL